VSIERRLLIIVGQEGTGKSTLTRALVPHVQPGAAIDAEDVGQVNPWQWNDAFKNLLWDNVAALVFNFWQAGYANVIAGSFINDYADFVQFRSRLDGNVGIHLVQLCASRAVRDQRRIARPKATTKEWRDDLDRRYPEDTTLRGAAAEYGYTRIDNSLLSVAQTVAQIKRVLPEIFGPR
jgi:energy-coupling factor transporter ATP-binding protein EcfA2